VHRLVAAAMTLGCLTCATHLVARPVGRAWAHASTASAVMVVGSPALMLTAGHRHTAPPGPLADALAWGVLLAPGVALAFAFYGYAVTRAAAVRPA
jgi:hypothetical protein